MITPRCGHFDAALGRHCWSPKTRRYLTGWRCPNHEPAKIAPHGGFPK